MISTASDAYKTLLDMAGRGHKYVTREVLTRFTGNPEATFGCGFDEDPPVAVIGTAPDQQLEGLVGIRLIRTPEDLLVRVRLTWQSAYGSHASVMSCRLTTEAAARLDETGERDAKTVDGLLRMFLAPGARNVGPMLGTVFAMAKPYQARWLQDFPRMMRSAMHDMVAEYHRRAVGQARVDYPDVLGLLSPTYLDAGRLSPADLIGLCSWLQGKRPATSAA